MAPPLHLIPASELEQHVTSPQPNSPFSPNPSQRARKNNAPPPRALSDCPLKELTQYKCNAEKPKRKGDRAVVICEPVIRSFRVCANGMHVETTAWEQWKAGQLQREGQMEGNKV